MVLFYVYKRRAQRDSAEKPSKFRLNAIGRGLMKCASKLTQ